MPWVLKRKIKIHPNSLRRQVARALPLVAETKDMDFVPAPFQTGKLPGKVLDVYPGSSVDVGRIFVGQKSNLHSLPPQER
jgi:hypothetical protein